MNKFDFYDWLMQTYKAESEKEKLFIYDLNKQLLNSEIDLTNNEEIFNYYESNLKPRNNAEYNEIFNSLKFDYKNYERN